jgi:hypothetical protein
MLGHMAAAVAGVSTAVAGVSTAVAGVSTAVAGDFMAADFTRWAGFTVAGFTVADSTVAGSTTVVSTITGFSSVDRLDIPGGIIRTMGMTITANPTRRRLGTIVPILPGITLM